MKATTTIKGSYAFLHFTAAFATLGEAIKIRLLRMLAEKPMNEKEAAQALELSAKREHYWQQITTGSSRF